MVKIINQKQSVEANTNHGQSKEPETVLEQEQSGHRKTNETESEEKMTSILYMA